jgi:glycine reductase
LERKGITTVCVTALYGVAESVGANRIMKAGGKFHYPLGNPELTHDVEVKWRRRMVEAALTALTRQVKKPTVFAPEDLVTK